MPEGPEVETIRRTLESALAERVFGQVYFSGKNFRHPLTEGQLKKLENSQVKALKRHGKVLGLQTNKKHGLLFHMGMSGRLYVRASRQTREPHTHVEWALKDSEDVLCFVDPRRFGSVQVVDFDQEWASQTCDLGPDPLHWTKIQQDIFKDHIKKSGRSVKALLLDQKVVAGVGNIYACEALFAAQIYPETCGRNVSGKQLNKLVQVLAPIMQLAVDNCGTTFSNYVDGNAEAGKNFHYLKIFRREGRACPNCEEPIKRLSQNGRSTFYCGRCQEEL